MRYLYCYVFTTLLNTYVIYFTPILEKLCHKIVSYLFETYFHGIVSFGSTMVLIYKYTFHNKIQTVQIDIHTISHLHIYI